MVVVFNGVLVPEVAVVKPTWTAGRSVDHRTPQA